MNNILNKNFCSTEEFKNKIILCKSLFNNCFKHINVIRLIIKDTICNELFILTIHNINYIYYRENIELTKSHLQYTKSQYDNHDYTEYYKLVKEYKLNY